MTARSTNGLAPSCTRTTVLSGRRAARPEATESLRSAPPATRVRPGPATSARNGGGDEASPTGRTTTTWQTSGWEVNGRTARSSTGTPARTWYCFGVPLPSRVLRPAATTTTPTSRGKRPHQLIDPIEANQSDAGNLGTASRGSEDAAEAQPCRLGHAP